MELIPASVASKALRQEIVELCELAYDEDVAELFQLYTPEAHVIARRAGALVAHAMWVTRWLQVDDDEPIRTGYVEFVATHPALQGRGIGTAVMQHTAIELRRNYALAALCPATPAFYEKLGWTHWRGPLEVRETSGERTPTTDEEIMILWFGRGAGPDVTRTLSIEWRDGEVW